MENNLIIYSLIGIMAGVLSGMFGIGGGVVIVPALMLLMGFTLPQASGTSLMALLLPVGIFAVVSYHKAKLLNIKISLIIALGIIIGNFFGSITAVNIDVQLLKLFYALFLLWVALNFINLKDIIKKLSFKSELSSNVTATNIITNNNSTFDNFYFLLPVGLAAGYLSGLFGIGGGLVIVPVLIKFLKFDTKKAIGTSLGSLLLPVGLPGVLVYNHAGVLIWAAAIPVAAGLFVGSIFGAKITISLPSLLIKRIYGAFLLIMSFYFTYQSLVH
ncbi:MAG: sulfite exporter TauE/SafE family protein [Candidatus Kapabacteria bacterium]|nr:sulfite exporter TauE/SafE family protein [Candidatus Kapabacteria bacterium]